MCDIDLKGGGMNMSLFDLENSSDALSNLKKNIISQRIPINANIYMTNKCNFRCLHCYVQSQKNNDSNSLDARQWKEIIDILKEKGCLSITFSGGEILSSNKFIEVYEYAHDANFCISLISNISLLNQEHVRLFRDKKPYCIIITLYGTSNDTYGNFCGANKGWDIVEKNILLLKSYDINIQIQTVLNTINFHELKDMKQFADSNAIPFVAFRSINCEIDGNSRPLQYQISPKQEIESFEIMGDGDEFLQSVKNNVNMWDSDYKRCFAGLTNCYIDCQGNLFLCNHSSSEKYNILEHGFDFAWENMFRLRQAEIETVNACSSCANKNFCGKCTPTFKKLESSVGYPFPDCKKVSTIKDYLLRKV